MRIVTTLSMMAAYVLCVPCALAQTLNFTNDFSHIKGENADPALHKDQPVTAHFPAGSAIWAVLDVSGSYTSVRAFGEEPTGGAALRKIVEMVNAKGAWDIVSTGNVELPANVGTGNALAFDIIPDKPNGTPAFNVLLDMIAEHKGPQPILIRVRLEKSSDSKEYIQNGFYLDVANGLGRYGEWLAQRDAARKAVHDAFEQQHLQPRTDFVRDYRSLRTDPKFVDDVAKWWKDHGGGSRLLSTKVCSASYIIVRDSRLGYVTDKQLCALITYKSDNQCFAMMRRFSYPSVGSNTFDTSIVDASYDNLTLPADEGETFYAGQGYAIGCNAAR